VERASFPKKLSITSVKKDLIGDLEFEGIVSEAHAGDQ